MTRRFVESVRVHDNRVITCVSNRVCMCVMRAHVTPPSCACVSRRHSQQATAHARSRNVASRGGWRGVHSSGEHFNFGN